MNALILSFVKIGVVLGLWLFAGLILALIIAPAFHDADAPAPASRLLSFAGMDQ